MSQTLNASPHRLREAFYALSIAQAFLTPSGWMTLCGVIPSSARS